MAQSRDAPAYQEYPANFMARIQYRVMSLAERGLLLTLRHECWVNKQVPADPCTLARMLGYEVNEVSAALPAVMPYFALAGGCIVCPELDAYRAHLEGIRERQSQGGRQGAAKTNSKHTKPLTNDGPGDSTGDPRVRRESLVQLSSVQPSSIQVLSETPVSDEWVNEYDSASNGY
ncbi:MAG: hypothetical protein RBT42_08315 [Aquabacterium sp.]|jgi:uncharacterized protein YdaU (DUF1376 family)|uniref:hypothetical protein n=1 Tax=Aquabacterium sp. TaxID=1872578 RepID=UPI002A35BFE7|nr:hypothetical protein [Aquabacterium sp.]MDX9843747.1 hypothetical protein [Aquabacterium sp.]